MRGIWLRVIPLLCLVIVGQSASLLAQEGDDKAAERLLRGAKAGQVGVLQQVLPGADADARDADGRTALMHAVAGGHFDAARFLLWNGADAAAVDKEGKAASAYLKPGGNGFTPLNLLLRCYAFLGEQSKPAGMPKLPHMVLINDSFIDHEHGDLKGHYHVNKEEAGGKPGVDDDGNGFVDDLYGWNVTSDEALRLPMLSLVRAKENRDFIQQVLPKREQVLQLLASSGEEAASQHPLLRTFDNPLVRDFGFEPLQEIGVELNDFAFAELIIAASHGTHVAGIALENSGRRAVLHAMAHGHRGTPRDEEWVDVRWATALAQRSETYADFVEAIRGEILRTAVKQGKRSGAYIRECGAGVVNMSYGRNRAFFRNVAEGLQKLYRDSGADPASIETYKGPVGLDVSTDLAIELAAARAAEFALPMADNPQVLFVLAAGNDGENNDLVLPSPAYLSRLLPNAISVAWATETDALSESSNYGRRSVQFAALGQDVESTVVGDGRGKMSGTSMAAPAVAGVAALIRAERPELSAAEVRRILETSVRKVPALEDRLDTGGVLDSNEALRVAKEWRAGRQRLSKGELARLGRPEAQRAQPESKPKPKVSAPSAEKPGESTALPILISDPGPPDKESWRVTSLGGFGGGFAVVMSRGAPDKAQAFLLPEPRALEMLGGLEERGLDLTAIAGTGEEIAMVMSTSADGDREQVVTDYDQTAIREALDAGFAITGITGFGDEWQFVLTAETGWGHQRFTLPSAFGESRKKWIAKLGGEGYRITNVAGAEEDSWIVVMTKGSALGDQVFSDAGPWPTEWIDEQWTKGFMVTSVAGYDQNWVVVMSKGVPYTQQRIRWGGDIPVDWVKEVWPQEAGGE